MVKIPEEWRKYLVDGEFDCEMCKHDGDDDECGECWDYGNNFEPIEVKEQQ